MHRHPCTLLIKLLKVIYISPCCYHLKKKNEVTQSCPTLCNLMDCSLPGSSVHGIFQTRVLEWVAISFSRGSSQPRDRTQASTVKSLSRIWLFATPWTVAYQASQSMGFFRQEYWSGLPFPSPGDLPERHRCIEQSFELCGRGRRRGWDDLGE